MSWELKLIYDSEDDFDVRTPTIWGWFLAFFWHYVLQHYIRMIGPAKASNVVNHAKPFYPALSAR